MRRPLLLTATFLLLAACNGGSSKATSTPDPKPSIEGVQTYTGLSQKHLAQGQQQTYPQSPPVGGPHSQVWIKCRVYTTAVPDINAVHALEHGGVWITYLPSAKPDVVAELQQYDGLNTEYVLVSPYPGQDSPIVLTAWGAQLKLTDPKDPRIVGFVRAYAGNGPERVTCASSGATLEQVLSYDRGQ